MPFDPNLDEGQDYNRWPGSDDTEDPYGFGGFGRDYNQWLGGADQGWLNRYFPNYAGVAGQGGSAIMRMLQSGGGQNMADLSSVLGGFSSGEKANRVIRGNFTQNYDRLMMDSERNRNANESDAMKKLAQTSYIQGGGSNFHHAPTLSLGGRNYESPDLGFAPPPISDAERQGASSLQPQLQQRLQPGGSYTPQPLSSYAEPGLGENIGSYGAAATGGIGTILSMLGGNGQAGGGGTPQGGSAVNQTLGIAGAGLGIARQAGLLGGHAGAAAGGVTGASGTSALGGGASTGMTAAGAIGRFGLPAVGAATGIYGLSQNRSTGSNVMNGVNTGASIGTMIMPGWGTAIGAGVGALYGALQSWLTVTDQEKSGRATHQDITNFLTSQATPEQRAGAQQAGWADPNQALSLIVIRDSLIRSGMPAQQAIQRANEIKASLYKNEGAGSEDVARAFQPVQSLIGRH